MRAPPRKESLGLLKRWMALDRQLFRGEVQTEKFAREQKVKEETIRRDLRMFRDLLKKSGRSVTLLPKEGKIGWRWKYPPGQHPIFTASESPLSE